MFVDCPLDSCKHKFLIGYVCRVCMFVYEYCSVHTTAFMVEVAYTTSLWRAWRSIRDRRELSNLLKTIGKPLETIRKHWESNVNHWKTIAENPAGILQVSWRFPKHAVAAGKWLQDFLRKSWGDPEPPKHAVAAGKWIQLQDYGSSTFPEPSRFPKHAVAEGK